jgi:aspartate racemase
LYYKMINQAVRAAHGGLSSARLLIHSLNYEPIVAYEREGKWDAVADILAKAARSLEEAGADFLILGCNTLHKVSPAIESAIRIPFLHIADAAADSLLQAGIKKVGLLGTQFTMEEGFYARRLEEKYGLQVIVPPVEERRVVDSIVYDELCVGKVAESSRLTLAKIMKALVNEGAQGVLLGCTELGMVVQAEDAGVPIFDTTVLHAEKAVVLALS